MPSRNPVTMPWDNEEDIIEMEVDANGYLQELGGGGASYGRPAIGSPDSILAATPNSGSPAPIQVDQPQQIKQPSAYQMAKNYLPPDDQYGQAYLNELVARVSPAKLSSFQDYDQYAEYLLNLPSSAGVPFSQMGATGAKIKQMLMNPQGAARQDWETKQKREKMESEFAMDQELQTKQEEAKLKNLASRLAVIRDPNTPEDQKILARQAPEVQAKAKLREADLQRAVKAYESATAKTDKMMTPDPRVVNAYKARIMNLAADLEQLTGEPQYWIEELFAEKKTEGESNPFGKKEPVEINGPEQYNALPVGAQYIAPDGSIRRKR